MADKHWIETAIEHHGAFKSAAEKAGKSTAEFAKEHEKSPGVMGHRARLAQTLMHLQTHDSGHPSEYSTDSMPGK
jgi:hypothetical protein